MEEKNLNNEMNENGNEQPTPEVKKPTLRERIANKVAAIPKPVKKVAKIGGIVAGVIVSSVILGKITDPGPEDDSDDEDDESDSPFEG